MIKFDLSEKIYIELNGNYNILLIKDVKEFIRIVKEHIKNKSPDRIEAIKFIDEKAGEKLK